MDTDLTPLGEREDEELEVIPEQVESVSPQEGKPVTIVAEGLKKYFTYKVSGRKENRFRRQKLGFVFQSYHLLPNLTALENVMLPMQRAGGRSQAEMRERARMLLFQVGMSEKWQNHTPGRLSGGQQQRVAIARALANDPKVILADEPTGNLDTLNGKRIIELLKTLAEQGKTVIVVTHDRTIAKEADVRLEMEDGRIRGAGNSTAAPTRALAPVRKKKGRMRR